MKKIVLTGGGTAGHVTPNIALIPTLKEHGYKIRYIGAYNGIEKKLIEDEGIDFTGISTGKLRRYFDLKNFTDPFRVVKGYFQAKSNLKKDRPDIIFSKGGFVSVPVVLAAAGLKIPVVIHESDMTPGLANKISIPKASYVCCSFPETVDYLPSGKAEYTGLPIRRELTMGDKQKGKDFCGFTDDKKTILVIGGSLGAVAVNEAVRAALPKLLKEYNVIHLCGKGKLDKSYEGTDGYVQFEYIKDELKDLLALADVVISRAGANAIYELLLLAKPNVLIPLSEAASRGDQILNAKSFKKQGFSVVLREEDVTQETLIESVHKAYEDRDSYIEAMKNAARIDPIDKLVGIFDEMTK